MASIDEEIRFIEKEDVEKGPWHKFHRPGSPSVDNVTLRTICIASIRLLFLKFNILLRPSARGLQAAGSLFIKDPSRCKKTDSLNFSLNHLETGICPASHYFIPPFPIPICTSCTTSNQHAVATGCGLYSVSGWPLLP